MKGYPHMYAKGKWKLVSRRICEHFHGPAPSGRHQCAHSCGDRGCVNWRHVRWATPSENESDKIGHGTYQYGEQNPMATLTLEQVRGIRVAEGSYREIAARYGSSQQNVGKIKRGERWSTLV
jgi:hypothetical protein